jgi:drug/metabolite transporter (DMT)-like permease
LLYFITCSLIWGLTWIAIKFQFHSADSNVAVFYRFLCASLILFFYTWLKRVKLKFNRSEHALFIAQGFFMFCLNYLLTYQASHLASSALVALAYTSLIFFNMFGGYLFLQIPFDKKVVWGALLCLCGMGLISLNELNLADLRSTSLLGFGFALLGTISASAGNLFSLRNRRKKVPIAANNAWGMLYGCAFTLIFCLLTRRSFSVHDIDSSFVISFLYLTVFGTVISFGAYLKLIEQVGPTKAAFTSVVSPVIAVIVSFFFEDLNLQLYLLLGVVFCLAGNIIALVPGPVSGRSSS